MIPISFRITFDGCSKPIACSSVILSMCSLCQYLLCGIFRVCLNGVFSEFYGDFKTAITTLIEIRRGPEKIASRAGCGPRAANCEPLHYSALRRGGRGRGSALQFVLPLPLLRQSIRNVRFSQFWRLADSSQGFVEDKAQSVAGFENMP